LAIVIPVLIAILYYLYDVPKARRMHAQTKFCANCIANILQNINHRVTRNDLKCVVAAACLTIYPGKTMYSTVYGNMVSVYGNCPVTDIFCVKKKDGKNKILWKLVLDVIEATVATEVRVYERKAPVSIVGLNLDDIPLENGEIKIIVHCYRYFFASGNRCLAISNRSLYSVTARETFGFLVFNPKQSDRDSEDKLGGFFMNVVVFKPKPELFSETAPT
jgi:hypothetical protein